MSSFSLNHLSETEFESFCFELLNELGFVNVNWRKGTGLNSSPSDRGRDIECEKVVVDQIDGSMHIEKWFVECKHYVKGVPADKIQGALTWANTRKPDGLLIIASNFLANATKDSLEEYRENAKPSFKIKVWERPDLEKLSINSIRLLRKYKINNDFPFLAVMHPAHLLYIRKAPRNTLDYFFSVIENLNENDRTSVLNWSYYPILMPRIREPNNETETFGELLIDDVSYQSFKERCYELAEVLDQGLLIFAAVSFSIQHAFSVADRTSVGEKVAKLKDNCDFWQSILDKSEEEITLLEQDFEATMGRSANDMFSNKDEIRRYIEFTQEQIDKLPERTKSNYEEYARFCENVVSQLLLEEVM